LRLDVLVDVVRRGRRLLQLVVVLVVCERGVLVRSESVVRRKRRMKMGDRRQWLSVMTKGRGKREKIASESSRGELRSGTFSIECEGCESESMKCSKCCVACSR